MSARRVPSAEGSRSGADNKVFGHPIDAGLDRLEPGTDHHEPVRWCTDQLRAGPECGVSCDTFFLSEIAIELAEQGVAIAFGPFGEVGDEAFDLLAGGLAERLHATEISGVGLDQSRIELVLANKVAEAIAYSATTVIAVAIGRLWREFPGFASGRSRLSEGTDLLDRADPDAVGFAQSAVHGASLSHPHLGTMDQRRDIGRISVTKPDETAAGSRFVDGGLEGPALRSRVTEVGHRSNVNAGTAIATRKAEQPRVRYVPPVLEITQITSGDRELVLLNDLFEPAKSRSGEIRPNSPCHTNGSCGPLIWSHF